MRIYLDLVVLLNGVVDFLLILGTNRLTGYPPGWKRAVGASGLGGVYAGACLLPRFRFLGSGLWRLVFLVMICILAFGFCQNALHRGAVFLLLSMALGGLASGVNTPDLPGIVFCGFLLWLLCRVGFPGQIGRREYVTVDLCWQGRHISVTGLRDTGNTLRDPLTGEQVLVCGADVGEELLGLNLESFRNPAQLLVSCGIPGLRLIPYRTVGESAGMMVALRLKGSRINGKVCDPLVAFSPQKIGTGNGYRMLTGGAI